MHLLSAYGFTLPTLALVSFAGCVQQPLETERHETGLEREAQNTIRHDEPARLVALRSADDAEVVSREPFDLHFELANERDVGAATKVYMKLTTEHESRRITVTGPRVGPGQTVAITVPATALDVMPSSFNFSGQIRTSIELFYADNERLQTNSVWRHFHLASDGWHTYDDNTRSAFYDDGVLTDAGRLAREELRAVSPDFTSFTGLWTVQKLSNDANYIPTQEGEP